MRLGLWYSIEKGARFAREWGGGVEIIILFGIINVAIYILGLTSGFLSAFISEFDYSVGTREKGINSRELAHIA